MAGSPTIRPLETRSLQTRSQDRPAQSRSPLGLRIGFWICIVIAVAVVIRRVLAIASPSNSAPPAVAALDAVFASHAVLTLAHILPALAFVLIVPFYFFGSARIASWAERVIFPLGAWVGLSAYAMSFYSVGGWTERSAVLFFNTLFLFSLLRAWLYQRKSEPYQTHRWLLRAIVVLLGIATTRPVMGVFFATASKTHLTPNQFFGIAFWIGFSINWIVVELWLSLTRVSATPRAV
ncbi:MAG TPA: DUF2306 domain-containing protein [Acidobacteriaceae bacterium]|jgi:hypothetical protein|nr:DUF2306 domain-containing protein [Acidobacteriaceae bacterium]